MKLQSPLSRTNDEILARVLALRNQLAQTKGTEKVFKNKSDPALKNYQNHLAIRIEELSWVLGIIPPFNQTTYDA